MRRYLLLSYTTPKTVSPVLLPGFHDADPPTAAITAENSQVIAIRKYPIPAPTVIFLKPGHLEDIVGGINKEARLSWFLHAFAARHKAAALTEGFVTNQSLWDRLVFDGARATVLGHAAATLRAVIVSGGTYILHCGGNSADSGCRFDR